MELNKLYKKADNYLTNLSIGLGRGVTNQLEGLSGMIEHPVNTLQGLYGIASQPGQIPGMVKNALVDTARRGTSGPMGLGEVIGENVGFGRRAPSKLDMTVYHGSPHDFDQFDLSKIGTGEGAQAYGHGLYVAESDGVARAYQNTLSKYGRIRFKDGTTVDVPDLPYNSPEQIAGQIWMNKPNLADAKFALSNYSEKHLGAPRDAVLKELENLDAKGASLSGRMYTVDIPDSHIANMLDWDAPLSEHPASVRKALERAVDEVGGEGYFKQWEAAGGSDWPELKVNMMDEALGDAEVSKLLAKHGISGIKYFDGASRTAKDGTRNYVVFDDKLLKILKKE